MPFQAMDTGRREVKRQKLLTGSHDAVSGVPGIYWPNWLNWRMCSAYGAGRGLITGATS